MKKADVTCPHWEPDFRRLELTSERGSEASIIAQFAMQLWSFSTEAS